MAYFINWILCVHENCDETNMLAVCVCERVRAKITASNLLVGNYYWFNKWNQPKSTHTVLLPTQPNTQKTTNIFDVASVKTHARMYTHIGIDKIGAFRICGITHEMVSALARLNFSWFSSVTLIKIKCYSFIRRQLASTARKKIDAWYMYILFLRYICVWRADECVRMKLKRKNWMYAGAFSSRAHFLGWRP